MKTTNNNSVFNINRAFPLGNSEPLDIAEWIANKKCSLLWGKGYYISTENEHITNLFKTIHKSNDLFSLFYQSERFMSVYGKCVFVIDKMNNGEMVINIGDPKWNCRVDRINNKVYQAEINVNFTYNNESTYCRSIYTKDKIVRTFLLEETSTNILNDKQKNELYHMYNLKPIEPNPFDFIPVFSFSNKPIKSSIMHSPILADAYPDLTAGSKLQDSINFLWRVFMKEAEFNRTRVFADITSQEMRKMIEEMNIISDNASAKTDYGSKMLALVGDFIVSANMRPNGATGKSIEVIQGNPNFATYIQGVEYVKSLALEVSGLSPKEDSTAVATTTQILFSKSDEFATIIMLANLRGNQYKDLLDCLLKCYGLSDEALDEYSFNIKKNLIIDKTQEIDNSIKLIGAGLSSPLIEIKKIHGDGGMSEAEAESLYEKITADNDEIRDKDMEYHQQQQEVIDNDDSIAKNTPDKSKNTQDGKTEQDN